MPVQDRKDARSWFIFRSERMRAHRDGKILCGEGDQQEDDGWEGTYGTSNHYLNYKDLETRNLIDHCSGPE